MPGGTYINTKQVVTRTDWSSTKEKPAKFLPVLSTVNQRHQSNRQARFLQHYR